MDGPRRSLAGVIAIVATGALLGVRAQRAQAQRPPSLGDGAPSGQSGIQLYNFSSYLEQRRGRDPVPGPARRRRRRTASARPRRRRTPARLERVFAFLQSRGHQERRALRLSGQPVPGHEPGHAAQPRRARRRCARSATSTASASPAATATSTRPNWDNQIAASKILGQDHIGESGFPGGAGGVGTYQATLNTAQLLNRLGKRSVEAGLGPAYFHNHQPSSRPALHGQRRAQERLGDHHGAHRPALGRRADRHRLGGLRRLRPRRPRPTRPSARPT